MDVVDYVTQRPGGLGAVRELCDLIIRNGYYKDGVK
jgi:3-deoxy-D-manno-octulosonate 8-phosphate phosphatase (KDO 8-P phosphatase)